MVIIKTLCGSNYFFKNIENFKAKDTDRIEIVDKGNNFKYMQQTTDSSNCIFKVIKRPKEELISFHLESNNIPPMAIGKFLIPEFNKEFNITIEDLKELKPLVDKLDDRHKYEEIIYNAYIENNDFVLTDEQLQKAYKSYCESRNIIRKH